MGVLIEHPDTSEVDAITDLWLELAAGQRDHGSHILTGDNATLIRESIVRHVVGETLLVARSDGGDIAGFVMFTVQSGSYQQDITRGIVENLYVRPEARQEGIGSALLDAAEQRLAERGADAIALEVMARNERARSFYRRQGYEPHRIELERSVESDTHSKGGE